MSRLPRIVATVAMVLGVVAFVLGIAVYVLVHNELADQKITVSSDAPFLAGDEVDGPFSAYAEAMAINDHALEAGGGLTYAELPQDDPKRETVMTADFLQASLFTSVVAFGVAALVAALGVVLFLFGLVFRELDRRTADLVARASAPAHADAVAT
jgi:hypothetical protein